MRLGEERKKESKRSKKERERKERERERERNKKVLLLVPSPLEDGRSSSIWSSRLPIPVKLLFFLPR